MPLFARCCFRGELFVTFTIREYLVEPKIVWFPTIEFCSSRRTESGGWFRGCDMAVKEEIGKEGTTFTDLRPAGKVNDRKWVYDAVSDGRGEGGVKYQAGQVKWYKLRE